MGADNCIFKSRDTTKAFAWCSVQIKEQTWACKEKTTNLLIEKKKMVHEHHLLPLNVWFTFLFTEGGPLLLTLFSFFSSFRQCVKEYSWQTLGQWGTNILLETIKFPFNTYTSTFNFNPVCCMKNRSFVCMYKEPKLICVNICRAVWSMYRFSCNIPLHFC